MTAGPQLSSVATALTEMTDRVTEIAEQLSGTERDDLAVVLFEVERSLKTASRRLGKVVAQLT
jgi:DNA/RNA-binding domain of Phe-tRNA-synthetase-like protein